MKTIYIQFPIELYDWMNNRNGGVVSAERQIEVAIAMNLRAYAMQDPPESIQSSVAQINSFCQPIVTTEPPAEPEPPTEG